ncbi:MAG: tRNA (adenosine(37)-N6)-dimethylallyltransferase MiaA [Clostridia bacterium]|nr:tRNA (adenosine(37)-N6)-dimethylallyltransferase MiaA [Clostridia bacterium]
MVQKDSLKPLIIVCGPTASGKTALAVRIAKYLDTSVISADSIAIYKGLKIGTAKPTEAEMQGVKHYLIDFIDADKDFTVAEYTSLAKSLIDRLHSEGKIPIVCGGTGYYIDSILYDLSYGNCKKDDELRKKYARIAEDKGARRLYEMLEAVDPESSAVLHENDVMRVSRALEIFELTGKRKSEIVDKKTPNYNYIAFSFDFERERLYKRIDERVDKMIADGLIEEVESLIIGGLDKNCQSMQAIGYKEVVEGLSSGCPRETIAETIKRNTRRYAKRQITYFKRLENRVMLDPDDTDIEKQIIRHLKNGRFVD